VQGRRAVQHHELEALAHPRQALPQAELALLRLHQLQVGADQVLGRGNQPQVLEAGRQDNLLGRGCAGDQAVSAWSAWIFSESYPAGSVRLRIAVHQQCRNLGSGKGGSQVNGRGGLAYASLLVGYRNYPSHVVTENRVTTLERSPPDLQCRILVQLWISSGKVRPQSLAHAFNTQLFHVGTIGRRTVFDPSRDFSEMFHVEQSAATHLGYRNCSTWNNLIGPCSQKQKCSTWNN